MSSPQAFEVVETRFRALWPAESPPAFFENETVRVASGATYLLVEVFGDIFDQASIGGGTSVTDNLWREDGQVQVHVLVPRGAGTLAARQHARQAIDIFRGLDIGGVRFRAVSIGAGEIGKADGNYWKMTATIDFERDE